jgi:phosphoadenosine phosphosulfate reductase
MRSLSDQLSETLQAAAQHRRLVFLCSFQKEESVILDELLKVAPHTRVVTIDTGVLFPETLQTWKKFEDHYGVHIDVEDASNPTNPWTGPEHCCTPLKVAALEHSLDGAEAWVTGIRRDQAETRAHTELIEDDAKRAGVKKYNPLAFWTEKDVWSRILERNLPYHPNNHLGYASSGAATGTQRVAGPAGRWAGTDKTECGIHVV